VAGWAREASSGLVGVARKDGERGARAVYQYLQSLPATGNITESLDKLRASLGGTGKPVVLKEDIQKLNLAEQDEAERLGLEEFKFATNEEMLEVMGLA
jgi:ferredoxin--NADP+ reductase